VSALEGLRVMVLEDEPIVAMMLEDMLVELGCDVIGPAYSLNEGLSLAARGGFDAAVLDINLNGQRSDAVALALDARGTPYTFATGYGAAGLPECGSRRVIQKPYTLDQLAAALGALRDG
jgi:CheY-like chemotaxis protein